MSSTTETFWLANAGAVGLEQAGVERLVVPGGAAGRRARAGRHPEGVGLADLVRLGSVTVSVTDSAEAVRDGRVPVERQVIGARAADAVGVGEAGRVPGVGIGAGGRIADLGRRSTLPPGVASWSKPGHHDRAVVVIERVDGNTGPNSRWRRRR